MIIRIIIILLGHLLEKFQLFDIEIHEYYSITIKNYFSQINTSYQEHYPRKYYDILYFWDTFYDQSFINSGRYCTNVELMKLVSRDKKLDKKCRLFTLLSVHFK